LDTTFRGIVENFHASEATVLQFLKSLVNFTVDSINLLSGQVLKRPVLVGLRSLYEVKFVLTD